MQIFLSVVKRFESLKAVYKFSIIIIIMTIIIMPISHNIRQPGARIPQKISSATQ